MARWNPLGLVIRKCWIWGLAISVRVSEHASRGHPQSLSMRDKTRCAHRSVEEGRGCCGCACGQQPRMPVVGFMFSVEQLSPEKREEAEGLNQVPTADDIGSLLFRTRDGSGIDTLANARERGISWYPELQYSVVNVFADTWACICCRCPSLGCSMPVKCCGFHLYKLSLTRAQWLWAFNLVCLMAHLAMAYLCITACGGDRFGTVVNSNCTASAMEVPILRMSSNCKNTPLEPSAF